MTFLFLPLLTQVFNATGDYHQEAFLPIVAAALAIGSTVYGAAKSAAANRKAERKLKESEAEENAWYNKKYVPYADTEEGQNMIRKANDLSSKYFKKASGAAAVGGATSAEAAQVKENTTKSIGDTVANMAARDTARKDSADAQHLAAQRNFASQQAAIEQQKGQNIATMASGLGNAAMSVAALSGGTTSPADTNKSTGAENQQNISTKGNFNAVNDLLAKNDLGNKYGKYFNVV